MNGRIGAVVLAGGRSSRFGTDKLAVQLDDRPLLDHALAAVRAVDPGIDLVVAGTPGIDRPLPDGARFAPDAQAFEGPLAGLATGLGALDPAVDVVLVVGGDMPWLMPAVLRRMLDELATDGAADVVALDEGGRARPLPLVARRVPAAAAIQALLAADERRLGSLLDRLHTVVLAHDDWRAIDPDGATIRDVDTPADLPADPSPETDHRRRP